MPKDQRAEAQGMLDQLWNEQLIPFPLTIGGITREGDEYTIHFHDSRIRTVQISLAQDQPFTEGVRAAVLERVAKMSGPLTNWQPEKGGHSKE
jgi:hypothetical protein